MAEIHDLLQARGKTAALEAGVDRAVVEAASLYMSDEDNAFNFVYSGWAQCALPHRRLADDAPWEIAADRIRLVVEPGRRPSCDDGPLEWIGVPFGSHARLILLYLRRRARLLRAVRALARDGAPAAVSALAGRGRQQRPADRRRDTVLHAVAAILGETPQASLHEIGERLTALRCYPPRGGIHWAPSSLAHLRHAARTAGLLPAPGRPDTHA